LRRVILAYGQRARPDPLLNLAGAREFLPGLTSNFKNLKSAKPRVEILTKKRADFRLLGSGKQVDAKISRADRVGLFDDQLAASVKARHRPRKTESEKKPKQREHRRVDGPRPFIC